MPTPSKRNSRAILAAVSQENVEIVRRILTAFEAGERDRALALVDPDVVVDATRRVFNPATYVGLDGIREMFSGLDEAWDEVRLEHKEFLHAGDRVAVISRMIGRGKGSGVEVERPVNGQVWTLRDGRVVRLEFGFTSRQATLEVAGLSE